MAGAVKVYKHFETPKKQGVYFRLICLTGEDKGRAYFLIGKRIVLGRSETCDITIIDIKSSREHAEIILVGENYILTDLGSQNGIIVNDLKIKQHVLASGDKVIVGKTVYKFSEITVEGVQKVAQEKIAKGSEDQSGKIRRGLVNTVASTDPPKNKSMTRILLIILVLGFLLIILDDSDKEVNIRKKREDQHLKANVKEISESFARAIKQRKSEGEKHKEKVAIYFKRGLREYREGNYFRAIGEFESAKQLNPNDSLASFYLRKTKEKLDEEIESYFNRAIRDIDAVSYEKAVISYCAVIRLLFRYKSDPRFIVGKEGILNLEKLMGMDEGEIKCIDSEKDKT